MATKGYIATGEGMAGRIGVGFERTNTGHCLNVASVAAHPLGSITASCSLDSFVRVFDVDSNATLEAPPSEVWQMCFDPKMIVKMEEPNNYGIEHQFKWKASVF